MFSLIFQEEKMENHLKAFVHKILPAGVSVVGKDKSLAVSFSLTEEMLW